jgi:hypothetical protein
MSLVCTRRCGVRVSVSVVRSTFYFLLCYFLLFLLLLLSSLLSAPLLSGCCS